MQMSIMNANPPGFIPEFFPKNFFIVLVLVLVIVS